MNTLIPGAIPLADAATPKAMPNGTTNAAMGAISMLPRHTPRAVKRVRSKRVETGLSPDMGVICDRAARPVNQLAAVARNRPTSDQRTLGQVGTSTFPGVSSQFIEGLGKIIA